MQGLPGRVGCISGSGTSFDPFGHPRLVENHQARHHVAPETISAAVVQPTLAPTLVVSLPPLATTITLVEGSAQAIQIDKPLQVSTLREVWLCLDFRDRLRLIICVSLVELIAVLLPHLASLRLRRVWSGSGSGCVLGP